MKIAARLSLALVVVSFAFACKSPAPKSEGARENSGAALSAEEKEPALSVELAADRSARVSNVHYALRIRVAKQEPDYTGEIDVRFDHAGAATTPLRLDFQHGSVTKVTRVGEATPVDYTLTSDGLDFPPASIRAGANALTITFRHAYSNDGFGVMKVVDPEDHQEYLYTNSEPYGASRAIPCFDQPDLKAMFSTTIDAPSDWEVVSTTRETSLIPNAGSAGSKRWVFPESLPISTYIWSVHAGPYQKWEDRSGRIPLRLFARKSLAAYVPVKDWFRYTQVGFRFYEKLFQTPYPFLKYDQLIVPEFAAGAMENAAAVTFNERAVSRGGATIRQKRGIADTLLHEMCHMWFGDLVTMKWWNGLWLNESFATYMSSLAMLEFPEFRDYQRVFHGGKMWAYWEDSRVTTHPIEVPIADTSVAESIFDGISYGKGSATLKQLHFLLGEKAFRAGLHDYFKRYAFRNTTLADFMGSLERASHRDLKRWTLDWLQTAGTNSLRADVSCVNGKVSEFRVKQSATPVEGVSNAPMRQHRFKVATFFGKGEGSEVSSIRMGKPRTIEVDSADRVIREYAGTECPAAVFLNDEDYGFFNTELDPKSRAFLLENFSKIGEPFLRELVLANFYSGVRTGTITPQEIRKLLGNDALWADRDELILNDLFGEFTSRGGMSTIDEIEAALPMEGAALRKEVETLLTARIATGTLTGDDLKLWWDTWSRTFVSDVAAAHVVGLLDGTMAMPAGLTLDLDRKWALVSRLAVIGRPEAASELARLRAADPSKFGLDSGLSVEAALPNLDRKRAMIHEVFAENPRYSIAQYGGILHSVFPFAQRNLFAQYRSEYFRDYARVVREKNGDWNRLFSELSPDDCTAASIAETRAFLATKPALMPRAEKALRIAVQANEECLRFVAAGMPSATKAKP